MRLELGTFCSAHQFAVITADYDSLCLVAW
jgi:hypothetical protein